MDFFLSYFIYFFYWILLSIIKSIEYIYLMIFQASEDNDANKIRVSKIMLRYKLTPLDMQMCRPQDFITLFDCYEKVDQLNDPHWTIYTIDKEYAYFVLLPDNMLRYDIVALYLELCYSILDIASFLESRRYSQHCLQAIHSDDGMKM
uniref:Uncharacterized protein n=1 Tax=Acrobeloides nanus TaxID=290746 RepID=A0A914BX73_9BILA